MQSSARCNQVRRYTTPQLLATAPPSRLPRCQCLAKRHCVQSLAEREAAAPQWQRAGRSLPRMPAPVQQCLWIAKLTKHCFEGGCNRGTACCYIHQTKPPSPPPTFTEYCTYEQQGNAIFYNTIGVSDIVICVFTVTPSRTTPITLLSHIAHSVPTSSLLPFPTPPTSSFSLF